MMVSHQLVLESSQSRITALHVINEDTLVVCWGNSMKAFHVKSGHSNDEDDFKEVAKLSVLPEGICVHGLVGPVEVDRLGGDELILVWGERCISLISIVRVQGVVRELKVALEYSMSDWIVFSQMSLDKVNLDVLVVVSLTAHNTLLKLTVDVTTMSVLSCQESCCDEKCILYSGFVHVSKANVVMAGTVFGHVVVWVDDHKRVLHSLKGHKGVIMSVSYDALLSLIVSTSDDRCVRVWLVLFEDKEKQRWDKTNIVCLASLEGHTARVFCHTVCHCNTNGHLIVSAGEDSSLRVWKLITKEEDRLRDEERDNATIEVSHLCDVPKVHNGSVVWSLATLQSSKDVLVISGGGDGSVRTTPLLSQPKIFSFKDNDSEWGVPRVVRMLDKRIFCLFQGGYVALYPQCDVDEARIVFQDNRMKNYGLMEASCEGKGHPHAILFLASLEGHVIRCSALSTTTETHIESKVFHSKVFSMHRPDDEHLLVCGKDGRLKLISSCDLSLRSHFVLPDHTRSKRREQRWPSSAVSVMREGKELLLFVGDCSGNVFLFNTRSKTLMAAILNVHDSNGVAALHLSHHEGQNHDDDDGESSNEREMEWRMGSLTSLGRDGRLVTLRLKNQRVCSSTTLVMSEVNRLSDLKSIERLVDYNDDQVLLGFHSASFVVFSVKQNRVLSCVECGGNHRSWDVSFNEDIRLSFIKDKKLYMASMLTTSSKMIVKGGHKAHCWSVCSSNRLVFTTGEDGVVLVHQVEEGEVRVVRQLRGHISSVRSVAVSECGQLVVSVGGRAQVMVWSMDNTEKLVNIDLLSSYFLKGNNRSVRKMRQWRSMSNDVVQDCEMRLMDVALFKDRLVILGSDGNLFLLRLVSSKIVHVFTTDESQCLPHACYLKCKKVDNTSFVTTSTDGVVRVWSIRDERLVLKRSFHVANAGLNSLCIAQHPKGVQRVLCGGDDGLIYISTSFKSFEQEDVCFENIPLHTSQITAIQQIETDLFLSVSTNQTLLLWTLDNHSDEYPKPRVLQRVLTSVSDVQDVCVFKGDRETISAIVVGEGIASYSITT